ncbi:MULTISPECIES: RNA polymerase sigma factor [Heyndrickxia]|jgi:RNA polymerase sigma-70 factor (ECF subfamily)|uniref:RNA polymerase sigma factor n=1 Tax=Heyndrickxia TaxID=2837504 RepID=UPI000903617F|nr:RNA polymerase sigma factor [Heyndrickxia oleronia]NYV67552.1 RNA polymerase sigma factor [Bacillus sp. Gen3]OJH17874.1 RNA polymerase subunit sigma-70 [Bacillus obstructivus]MBU5214416.1 RNA polymerase sigma factor [Heyndrickxia oleronia]MCI1589500.1 RNA polymerase sigma factor [Heyndrickxia oleronia]MCI1611446.1 RNA polymerase sigma factor [Heyndrickxia oleronia]
MKKSKAIDQLTQFIIENKEDFYRLAYSYVKNSEDALDIVQESIKKALIAKDFLKESQSIKSWFYKIVVNTSLDFLRKTKKISLVDEETLDFLSTGREDSYQNIDLKRSLEDLPIKYQSVIILRYFEDLKIDEIAEILHINVSTVKTRLYKALEILRIKMKDERI